MPTLQDPLMIVTDLDGSLLDHNTYDWQPAAAWLARLRQHHIPLVICSSKTAAEIIPLQSALGISGTPFIAENGAVVRDNAARSRSPFLPDNALSYTDLCQQLAELRQLYGFKFIGFADVSEKEVAEWTGLTLHDASLARMREASESLIWRDSREQFVLFHQRLEAQGLTLVQGGRFWHVMRQGSGKGAALRWLLHPSFTSGPPPLTLGLGDGPNDAPMLDAVDYAVVIRGYSKNPVILHRQDKQNIYHTGHYGPEGWSEGLTHFITQ